MRIDWSEKFLRNGHQMKQAHLLFKNFVENRVEFVRRELKHSLFESDEIHEIIY